MKGPVKAIILGVTVLVLVAGAFWGGSVFGGSQSTVGFAAGGDAQGMRGGPFADLTEEEQAELEGMTAEERQAWMEENMGAAPDGTMGGPARGGTLEGEVIEVATDSITISLENGSQTIYLDENTVIAYAEGAGELATGSQVMVIATPTGGAANGGTTSDIATASVVVVK